MGNLEVLMDFDLQHSGGNSGSPVSAETNGGSDGGVPHDESDCDHCCHGAAHFIGLVAITQRVFTASATDRQVHLAGVHQSPVFAPPLQPPNV